MTDNSQKRMNREFEELSFSLPARLERLWNDVKFPLLWSCAAAISLSLLVSFAVTRTGGQRLAMLPFEMQDMIEKRNPGASLTAALDQKLTQVRTERAGLEQRVALLEENYGDITASIPKRTPAPATLTAPPTNIANIKKATLDAAGDVNTQGGVTLSTRSQFGIELGTDQSMGALRTRWVKLMEQFGTVMAGYEPVISASDSDKGVLLHLVVGPFSNAEEAAATCAKLRTSGLSICAPVPYDGQRLALQ